MIKVLGLALYGPLAASTRYRLGQYVSGLSRLGIDLEIYHLLDDNYLRRLFSRKSIKYGSIFHSCLLRFSDLLRQHEYDLVMVYCELFPLMPGWVERTLLSRPYIYDYDDAFYLKYRAGKMRMARPLLGRKFESLITGASAVTAGNKVLVEYATKYNNNTILLPTVVDTDRYMPKNIALKDKVFTVGWIGSPSTAPYLTELIEPLSTIGKEGHVQFIVIGGKAPIVPHVTVIEIDWNEKTEVELINSFDVGVMPMPDNDWTRGKCAFKLIQYMACGVPVIASPVGANIDVINEKYGLFACTPREWEKNLRLLRDQPIERLEIGLSCRQRIVNNYSLQLNLPILSSVIRNVIAKN